MTLTERLATPPKKVSAATARILTVDIERQPGLTYRFEQRESEFVPVNRWVRLPSMLCLAGKWRGSRTVEFYAAWNDPDEMIRRSWEWYDAADIVVTYNGRRFDNKWLRTAWRDVGLPPPSPWKNVDLFAVNKAVFGAESYSLTHLCRQLGLPGKSGHYDPVVADECMAGDEKAQRLMRRYNEGDVRITERAYEAMVPWIYNHPHVAVDRDKLRCPKCGSDDVTPITNYRANVHEYAAYRCGNCGGPFKAAHVRRVARTMNVRDQ